MLIAAKQGDPVVSGWHVNRLVDVGVYAFGWVWILVPLLASGPTIHNFAPWFLLAMAVSIVHRHYTLPYVYLDSEVRTRFRLRFFALPAVLLALFAATPFLSRRTGNVELGQLMSWLTLAGLGVQILRADGEVAVTRLIYWLVPLAVALGVAMDTPKWAAAFAIMGSFWLSFRVRKDLSASLWVLGLATFTFTTSNHFKLSFAVILDGVALFAGLWNVWHVHMQKYGIFRMYDGKNPSQTNGYRFPPWLDRAFVFAWFPLLLSVLGPRHRDLAIEQLGGEDRVLERLLDALTRTSQFTIPLSTLLVTVVGFLWIRAEFRARPLVALPRVIMASGTWLMFAMFLVADPVKVYIAFGFGHGIEYMVFVWAFQAKRYAKPLAHRPLLGLIIGKTPARTWLAYAVFTIGLSLLFVGFRYTGVYFLKGTPRPHWFGFRAAEWIAAWGVYQSLQHFYYDGFLWKSGSSAQRSMAT